MTKVEIYTYTHDISSEHIFSFLSRILLHIGGNDSLFVEHPLDFFKFRVAAKVTTTNPLNGEGAVAVDENGWQVLVGVVWNTFL